MSSRKQHSPRTTVKRDTNFNANNTNERERTAVSRSGRQKNIGAKRSADVRMFAGKNELEASGKRPNADYCSSAANIMTFGPPISDDILDDICFRFLINIPDDQKNTPVRICFQIELAHWFYLDFYCKSEDFFSKCPEVSFRDFVGQIFCHCDFLVQYVDSVDKILEDWRQYKSAVPTYGAALLDSSMNYVLLVQGYYARNSWGFPKGKVNEEEEAVACAVREVLEEVGFDISGKIKKTRVMQSFVNDTLIRVYIIRDVPIDYPFAPTTRKEIGKIQWFSIWDLPKSKNDMNAFERTGMNPNCFYTVIPFVKELRTYVSRCQKMRSRSRRKLKGAVNSGACSTGAFNPVHPQQLAHLSYGQTQSIQKNETLAPKLSPLFASLKKTPITTFSHHSPQHSLANSSFFKSLTASTHQVSYTGSAFVQMISSSASCTSSEERIQKKEVMTPISTFEKAPLPLIGHPVYNAFKDGKKEKKAVTSAVGPLYKPWQPDVSCATTGTPNNCRNNDNTPTMNTRKYCAKNDIKDFAVCCEMKSEVTTNGNVEDNVVVNLCEAWKNFKFDVSQLT